MADTWTVTGRDLAHWVRQPATLVLNLLFMVMVVLLFGYLFGGAMTVPGGGSYREFLLPGMFALSMLFGVEATMVAVTTDAAWGVTDRFRAMPAALLAVVGGCAVSLTCSAWPWAWPCCSPVGCWSTRHWGAADAFAAVGLLLLLRFAFVWVGIYLGLLVRNPRRWWPCRSSWPIGFLSNAIAPTATMPGWLGTVAGVEPRVGHRLRDPRAGPGQPGWGGVSQGPARPPAGGGLAAAHPGRVPALAAAGSG